MSIVTFCNGTKDQAGVTCSAMAFAVQSALQHNMKIIFISTSLNDLTIKDGLWKEDTKKPMLGGSAYNGQIDGNGIEGLETLMRSGKISPNRVTEYTKVLLKDRLEVLLGISSYATIEQARGIYVEVQKIYPQVLTLASQYYDLVVVELSNKLEQNIKEEILKISNIIVPIVTQKVKNIQKIQEVINQNGFLNEGNTVVTIGKYMDETKYNMKNITRTLMRQKKLINTVPYNNLFFEALQEGKVIDLFFNFMKLRERDNNYQFVRELDRLFDDIKEKDDLLKMQRR